MCIVHTVNFEDSYNLLGMTDTLETCRVYRATIPLSFLQISDLYTVPTRFYESLNEKNRMCELRQIRSHISIIYIMIYIHHC